MAFSTSGFTSETQDRFNQLVAAAKARGIDLNYNSGSRSYEDQRQLYANWQAGRSGRPLPYPDRGAVAMAAKPGTSPHEFGVAFDVSATDPKRQAELNALGQGLGLKTIAGDPGHFQLADWKGGKIAPDAPATQIAGGGGSSGGGGASGTYGTTVNVPNAPVPGALSAQPLDTRQLVYNKLTAAGLQPHQALGAIWSLAGESGKGLNPASYNPNDPGAAVGIGQWTGGSGRRQALEAFAKARGTAVTDPNTQADFLVDELTNKNAATYQPGVFAKMQGASNAADATKVWTTQFERPKVDNSAARIKNGMNVASLDANNNFTLGAGGGGGGTAAPPSTAQSVFGALTNAPIDPATGQPKAGGQSPLQNLVQAYEKGPERMKQAEEEQDPEKNKTGVTAPPARNVSPGLANIQQTYGQTINSLSQPLTWNNLPPQAPQTPAAGFQASGATLVPGMSLNSFQPLAQGLGYGIPSIGYGFG